MLFEGKDGKKTVFGIFKNHKDIESTLKDLIASGFNKKMFSVLIPLPDKTQSIHAVSNYNTLEEITGGLIGSLLGIGAVLATGGIPIFAAGAIIAALGGTGVLVSTSAMIGYLISRSLGDYGIPDDEVYKYLNVIKKGGHLLAVHIGNSDRAYKAIEILKSNNAKDITVQKDYLDKSKWSIEKQDNL